MAKRAVVTEAQRDAAREIVARSEAAGRPVPPAVRKMAEAKVSPVPDASSRSKQQSRSSQPVGKHSGVGPQTSKRSQATTNAAARMTRRSGSR